MSGHRTPLSNGLLYGLIAGLFGGSLWALLTSIVPDEALVASRWIVLGGGFLFWFLVGFLVGFFNSPRLAGEIALPERAGHSLIQRILIAAGWFLYRLFVGFFVGCIAAILFTLVGFTSWIAVARLYFNLSEAWFNEPLGSALLGSMVTSLFCGISGGAFGALVLTRRSPFVRPALGGRVVRSSFLSFLFGIPFGASLGWLPQEEIRFSVCLAAAMPIGILSGILGGLWTDLRNLREVRNG